MKQIRIILISFALLNFSSVTYSQEFVKPTVEEGNFFGNRIIESQRNGAGIGINHNGFLGKTWQCVDNQADSYKYFFHVVIF